jgi:nitrogen fixation protein NifU and related proteins
MEEQHLDFWQKHSLRFLEMALRTDNVEVLGNPSGYGKSTGACGDTVEIYLDVKHGRIRRATFQSNGCLNTIACVNSVIQLIQGTALEDAWNIAPETVVSYLETLPGAEMHCAELAVGALYQALASVSKGEQRAPRS